ncbi:MAG: RluA family pseudouridine synthase [Coriobacteriia bacterium]|nr:RluA family pseudouridine synthase [Coriobacteriia bacterium]
MVCCIVDGARDGARVYDVLRAQLGVSDGCVRRAKHVPGGIQLDGVPVRANAPVRAGQHVALAIDAPGMPGSATDMAPQAGAVDVAFCDDDVLVVDKPAGLVMYPSPGHPDGTLANRVAAWLLAQGRQCGLHAVQRLDAGTSGLVVFALHSFAKERLTAQLHTDAFVREYVAVCEGWLKPDVGSIEAPVGLLSRSPNVFGVTPEGKPALTRFRVMERRSTPAGEPCSIVRLRLETGRTHQIRIHMAHVGHPLVGDDAYGRASSFIARPALHSQRVVFAHPVTGERVACESPLPPDVAALTASV